MCVVVNYFLQRLCAAHEPVTALVMSRELEANPYLAAAQAAARLACFLVASTCTTVFLPLMRPNKWMHEPVTFVEYAAKNDICNCLANTAVRLEERFLLHECRPADHLAAF